MPINWYTVKKITVYPFSGILLSSKKEETPDISHNMDKSQKQYAE